MHLWAYVKLALFDYRHYLQYDRPDLSLLWCDRATAVHDCDTYRPDLYDSFLRLVGLTEGAQVGVSSPVTLDDDFPLGRRDCLRLLLCMDAHWPVVLNGRVAA